MSNLKKILKNIKLSKISNYNSKNKILLIDRGRVDSVLRNYYVVKLLQEKTRLDPVIITDLKSENLTIQFYKQLGFKKFFRSFKIKYIALYPIFFLKFLKYFFYYLKYAINNDVFKFIREYKVENIFVGDIIFDRFIRNDYKFLNVKLFNIKFLIILSYTIYKIFYIEKFIKENQVKFIILNTHNYANNNAITFKLAKKLKINLIYSKGFQFFYFKKGNYSKFTDPRIITLSKLNEINGFKNYKQKLKKHMDLRLKGKLPHFDVKNAYANKKITIKKFLKKKVNLIEFDKKILLASHSLSDANHHYFEYRVRSPFESYYKQLIETLQFAKNHKNILFLVRPHPSSVFWHEEGLIGKICNEFKKFSNIQLVDSNFSTADLLNFVDTVITVYGTIGLECSGFFHKKPIIAGKGFYSDLGITLDSHTKEQYFRNILKNKNSHKMTKREIHISEKCLYYHEKIVNREYESIICSSNRLIEAKKYYNNFLNFHENKKLKKDNYLKLIEKKIKIIKY
jgi:hypothetical protein